MSKNPLVSVLIPAYNAEKSIEYTLKSVLSQTWRPIEIIVVNDGSTDRTADIVGRYASRGVSLISQENQGLCAAQNRAFRECTGDYIQWLDSDDMLAPNKIERQLRALEPGDGGRIVLSSPWAPFYYRTQGTRWVQNSLWENLTPAEWLFRKLRDNVHMQNATWLVSREVTEAAGPWDTSLFYDQDGEYFARVLLASEGTRFVSETGIYYRASNTSRISYIGNSCQKKKSLLSSMKLHIEYLRSLEDSERVRQACVTYLQNWFVHFYLGPEDLVAELHALAAELGGQLEPPYLSWKYAWIRPLFGPRATRWAQITLPAFKESFRRAFDRAMFTLESRGARSPVWPLRSEPGK